MNGPEVAGTLLGCVLLGVVVPWLGMRMFIPALVESSAAMTRNYAGRPVFYGLGVVWLIWAGCATIAGVAAGRTGAAPALAVLGLAGPLALVAFALGVVDDSYGTGAVRGFKGHVKALLRGRMTTGGLKLVGIGVACIVVALVIGQAAPWGRGLAVLSPDYIMRVVGAAAAIALTSNLINLMDLRPGRALKTYSVIAAVGSLVCAAGLAGSVTPAHGTLVIAIEAVALCLFALGPVLAVWRYDLREIGMLGDAGANPMGAVAGMLIVTGLPLWGLFAYLVAVFAANLASERVSFSRVIASNAVLSWLDGVGRLPVGQQEPLER